MQNTFPELQTDRPVQPEDTNTATQRLLPAGRSKIDVGQPQIRFGRFGSATTVLKSSSHRDELALKDKIVGFEMEGAGIWDNLPTIILKSVCDYADSHKNKGWQPYAAATAAAGLKAVLEYWSTTG